MKLLFILDSVESPAASNPSLARRVADQLANSDHTVHILELYDGEVLPPTAQHCTQHLLSFADERQMNQILEFGRRGGTALPLRFARLCLHPSAALAAVRQLIFKKPRRRSATKKAIERLDKQHHFTAAIAVSAPYAASFALAAADVSAKKASWQMDPYAANLSYQAPGGWPAEQALAARLDRVFVAPSAEADFAAGAPMAAYRNIMRVLDFPALVPALPQTNTPQPGNNRLRCVFVGSLYETLRTPHFALELFSALNDPDTELVFVGGGWQNYPADLPAACKAILGDRLKITGPLPKAEAQTQLANADVLINLGNGIHNQVPSKLFEYFAMGKPVLHLGKLANDPALPYLQKWPLACMLLEADGTSPPVLDSLRLFLKEKGRQRLSFSEAQRLYPANTPVFAAEFIKKELQ